MIEILNTIALNEGDGYKWAPTGPTVIYDGEGLETESEPHLCKFDCTVCGTPKEFDLRAVVKDAENFWKWRRAYSESEIDQIAQDLKIERVERSYGVMYKTELDLSPYIQQMECAACATQFLFCCGYGEKQPARYVAIDKNVHQIDRNYAPEDAETL